jgi:hypothetical protein
MIVHPQGEAESVAIDTLEAGQRDPIPDEIRKELDRINRRIDEARKEFEREVREAKKTLTRDAILATFLQRLIDKLTLQTQDDGRQPTLQDKERAA